MNIIQWIQQTFCKEILLDNQRLIKENTENKLLYLKAKTGEFIQIDFAQNG